MKVYFAGSIRGGRQDVSMYYALIAHLQTHAEVLTEHIGNKALSDGGEHDLSDDQIHARLVAKKLGVRLIQVSTERQKIVIKFIH